MKHTIYATLLLILVCSKLSAQTASIPIQANSVDLSGHLDDERAELTISANLLNRGERKPVLLYTTSIDDTFSITSTNIQQKSTIQFDRIQGTFKTIHMGLPDDNIPDQVSGKHLESWSIRHLNNSDRVLVLEFSKVEESVSSTSVVIRRSRELSKIPAKLSLSNWKFEFPALVSGELQFEIDDSIQFTPQKLEGLSTMNESKASDPTNVFRYAFLGKNYHGIFKIEAADPDALRVTIEEIKASGEHSENGFSFIVEGVAKTDNPNGASLQILGGDAALTSYEIPGGASLKLNKGSFVMKIGQPGRVPFRYHFTARTMKTEAGYKTNVKLPTATLFPVSLSSTPSQTAFQLKGSGPFSYNESSDSLEGFIPSNGQVELSWNQQEEEQSSRLFFNTQGQSQIHIGTGVMRQNTSIEVRIMQGELSTIEFDITGKGEITRVTAPGLLSWDVKEQADGHRTLSIRFNQAQDSSTNITVATLATIGDLPVEVQPIRITPLTSDRHHGLIEVINDGAVRLNVLGTTGLSRITPDTAPNGPPQSKVSQVYPEQRFAFRHSSGAYSLTIQASMIQPDIAASTLMLYYLDYDQTRIEADLEIDIREAPIRDFTLQLPRDYVLADVSSHQLSDFFLSELPTENVNQLRLVFSRPLLGRHQIKLRLEKNAALEGNQWALGRIVPLGTRQLRGHIGISSIEGYRLTPETVSGVTEIATVYFPKKVSGLQAAFRIAEADWNLILNAAAIPQAVLSDSFHMYTLGNGIINGSSLMHFEISGAPLDTLQFEVPSEYRNLEFTGDDVRNWSQTENRYQVTLQAPIIGSYSLLATFERSYNDENDTLTASGITPLATASDQGTILITSNRQIQLSSNNGSTALLQLTPEEISPENRLLIQQPVLAAFQYTERPFSLALAISTLGEASSRQQIVDRAGIETRIAHDGQSVTTIHYLLKTSGEPHFKLTIPNTSQLWSASVDQQKVIPINTENGTLIPLPPEGRDLRIVEIRLATPVQNAELVRIDLPTLDIPVLHSNWQLNPAPKHRLRFLEGTVVPKQHKGSSEGYTQLQGLPNGARPWRHDSSLNLGVALLLLGLSSGLILFASSAQIRSFRWRRGLSLLLGSLAGLAAFGIAVSECFNAFDRLPAEQTHIDSQTTVTPAAASSYIVVENRPDQLVVKDVLKKAWPFLIIATIVFWMKRLKTTGQQQSAEFAAWLIGFLSILSWKSGGPLSILLALVFLVRNLLIPAIRSYRFAGTAVTAPSALSAAILLGTFVAMDTHGAEGSRPGTSVPKFVEQTLRIEKTHAYGQVTVRWNALAGDSIELLREPGIITQLMHETSRTRISQGNDRPASQRIEALESGEHEISFEYQLPLSAKDNFKSLRLPTQFGLINQLTVILNHVKSELLVPDAISVQRIPDTNLDASTWKVIPPGRNGIEIQWQPQRRNRSEEKAVFFAEWTHLLSPSSGLVEGFHDLAIRPAQGEISRVIVTLPETITINDVIANDLSQWRFDPEENKVLVDLASPQSRPFLIRILSQSVTQPLPYTSTVAFPQVEGATGQVGSIGIAAEADIQIASINTTDLVKIDPQDFQTVLLNLCQERFPSATIRQAFRYTNQTATLQFQADEVSPHITVETIERLSLGEDRILLATQIQANISRAGIFSLSFYLPDELSIDSITGEQLSHWSDLVDDTGRLITLHLKQRWQGELRFDITLTGSGLNDTQNWQAPKITIQEANRQRGQLVIIPEQGIRLQASVKNNTSQVDARQGGFKAPGTLAFDLLNADWNLAFQLEQVAPWIEISSLQDVLFSEGKATITSFIDSQIKNTAIKHFDLQLPSNATNVRFEGEFLADSVKGDDAENGNQNWTVRLNRRVIGSYRLTLTYQIRIRDESTALSIQGVQILNTSSQRGYLILRSQGRLQIESPQVPATLYVTAWNNVPRSLRQSMPEEVAVPHSFRIVESSFDFPVSVTRHEVTSVLPAQIRAFDLTTIISPQGSTLTKAAISIIPGSKRSLAFTLPAGNEFWFAHFNGQAVSTWTSGEQLIVPLTQNLSEDSEAVVELFLQGSNTATLENSLDTTLRGLNVDLPANAVSWSVILDPQWELRKWSGDLELVSRSVLQSNEQGLKQFIENEQTRQAGRTKIAEDWLQQGNQYLTDGNDILARNAFKNAYGLTQHDAAFNEDARVQLRSVKTQQVMAGISIQQKQLSQASDGQQQIALEPNQSVQQILAGSDPAQENTLLNLADRLIEQHEDAASVARSFDITLPMKGTLLKFVKSVQVDASSSLQLQIRAKSRTSSFPIGTILIIAVILGIVIVLRAKLSEAR